MSRRIRDSLDLLDERHRFMEREGEYGHYRDDFNFPLIES